MFFFYLELDIGHIVAGKQDGPTAWIRLQQPGKICPSSRNRERGHKAEVQALGLDSLKN